MAERNDSPIIQTFTKARKLSSATSSLDCIAEKTEPQFQHQQAFLYSRSAASPTTHKRDCYNTFFYSQGGALQRGYHNFLESSAMPNEKCLSILGLPLLGVDSDDESGDEGWNQDCDMTSVQETTWNNCRLPLITESEFTYYPERAQLGRSWSRLRGESDEETTVYEKAAEPTMVERTYENKGLRTWIMMVLRKIQGRK